MTDDRSPVSSEGRGLSRRGLLLSGAATSVGAMAAIGIQQLVVDSPEPGDPDGVTVGNETVPFFGEHQAGIETTPQAHASFLALDLRPDNDRAALARMMRILSDDAARMTQGEPALADSEPELSVLPARLTVTFGFGPELVARAGGQSALPPWLAPLPAFAIDQLEDQWSGGDLLLQVAADDPMSVAHATRMLLKSTRRFATLRWRQSGFRRARGSESQSASMRNLFGQVDGTVNPQAGTRDFAEVVWRTDGWLAAGTSMVVRRISMDVEGWDRLERPGREQAVGRFLSNGAPLTGQHEFDEPDFTATTSAGFPVIPEFSHMARARSIDPHERFLRRPYNYDEMPNGDAISDSGQIFVAFQADVTTQFVPVQQRLSDLDIMNEWTVPIGSAVFAIAPGCDEGGFIGETLLS